MTLRMLVTGRNGQVTSSLQEHATTDHDVDIVVAARPDFDLRDRHSVLEFIRATKPDIIVNTAAYTAVDHAEDNESEARGVNAEGPRYLAEASAALSIPIIQLSTDYVFDGKRGTPYSETDIPSPKSVYGTTKLEGESAVAETNPQHIILRTSWVFSPYGGNFVKTMLRLAQDRAEINVVADQFGSPTSAADIARVIVAIARHLSRDGSTGRFGTYHLTGSGYTTWAGLAECVFEQSALQGGPTAKINSITTAQYPTRAQRPTDSRLNCEKLQRAFGIIIPPWQESVSEVVRRILVDGKLARTAEQNSIRSV